MKKLISIGMGLLLCLSSALWTGCDKKTLDEPATGDDSTANVCGGIKGVVTDGVTGEGISMALVELLPTNQKTHTDSMGVFSFSDLEFGTYHLRVSKDGYVAYMSDDIVINSEQMINNHTVSLDTELQILDMDGNEISVLDLKQMDAFMLKNNGNIDVMWEIAELTTSWIKGFSKQSGILAFGVTDTVNLLIAGTNLSNGENEAEVLISSSVGDKRLIIHAEMHFAVGSDYVETAFGIELPMVAVEGGTFRMGATEEQGEDASSNEKPLHEVTLDGFYIGKYEVTQSQWEAVMGTTVKQKRDGAAEYWGEEPTDWSLYGVGDDYPMYYVNSLDADRFCEKLSEMTGKKYRLPTEAEWEYAARGGQYADGTKYAGSNSIDEVAWYEDNSGSLDTSHLNYGAHSVGLKSPNGLGLYDMSGNVEEWCLDWMKWYSEYEYSVINPQWFHGNGRVPRGGSWRADARKCRVSFRRYEDPIDWSNLRGFRVVCEAK